MPGPRTSRSRATARVRALRLVMAGLLAVMTGGAFNLVGVTATAGPAPASPPLSDYIVFGLHEEVAIRVVSAMMGGYSITAMDEMSRSAISELGNMISGNASTMLFNQGVRVDITPPKLMNSGGVSARNLQGPLKLAQERYEALAEDFTEQLDKLDDQMANYQEHLTKVYAAMETRLSALKATQSYLEQQIEVWNNSNN